MATVTGKQFLGGKPATVVGNETSTQLQREAVNNPGYFSRVGSSVTSAVKEASEALSASAEGKKNPFAAGANIFKNATGAVLAPVTQAPVVKQVGEAFGKTGQYIADTKLGNKVSDALSRNVSPEVIGAVSDVIEGAMNTAAIEGLNVPAKSVSRAVQDANVGAATLETAKSMAKSPVKTTVDIISSGTSKARDLYDAVVAKDPAQMDVYISEKFDKAVRPSTTGKKTSSSITQYRDKSLDAVKTIVENKNNLQIVDEFGQSSARLPENLNEFAQAIEQTKRNIFKQYDDMANQAGEVGVQVDLVPVSSELNKVASNKVLQDTHPEVANYAKTKADTYARRGKYTPAEAQEAIQIFNRSLEAFYKNPSFDTASRAYIDSLVVNNLRSSLDSAVESVKGPGYQDIKNKYGSLKAIEKDVVNRAVVDARKNSRGLIDFADVFSGGQVLNGILTLNPAQIATGLSQKAITSLWKRLNDPNVNVRKLFEVAEKRFTSPSPNGLGDSTLQ